MAEIFEDRVFQLICKMWDILSDFYKSIFYTISKKAMEYYHSISTISHARKILTGILDRRIKNTIDSNQNFQVVGP